MTPENQQAFFAHAVSSMPREACAVVVIHKGREKLVTCRNISEVDSQFVIHPVDYMQAEKQGVIVAVVHSHVYISNRPSQADLVNCEATGLKWYICSVPTGSWFEFFPTHYRAPLVGREFSHGVLDCYSLIRDYYKDVLNIEIPDFDRDFEWWEKGQNLYLENFSKAGFFEVSLKELGEHDVVLMQIHSNVVNHGGVYIGNDTMLHHLSGRLSSREVFAGYYRKHCIKVLRHEAYTTTR